jgi:hypothetical protein
MSLNLLATTPIAPRNIVTKCREALLGNRSGDRIVEIKFASPEMNRVFALAHNQEKRGTGELFYDETLQALYRRQGEDKKALPVTISDSTNNIKGKLTKNIEGTAFLDRSTHPLYTLIHNRDESEAVLMARLQDFLRTVQVQDIRMDDIAGLIHRSPGFAKNYIRIRAILEKHDPSLKPYFMPFDPEATTLLPCQEPDSLGAAKEQTIDLLQSFLATTSRPALENDPELTMEGPQVRIFEEFLAPMIHANPELVERYKHHKQALLKFDPTLEANFAKC